MAQDDKNLSDSRFKKLRMALCCSTISRDCGNGDSFSEVCRLELGRQASWRLAIVSSAALLVFIGWVQLSPETLGPLTIEDGPIEMATALNFLAASIAFLFAAKRSDYLRSRESPWAYFMMLAWAVLMIVCCGEEISWGQRILGFDTPLELKSLNRQGEFNIHNLQAFDIGGGTYRYLSIFVILTGVVFPVLALTARGRKKFRQFCFPVAPLMIAPAFVGAYLFGKFYLDILPNPDVKTMGAINEVREFMISYAMLLYGIFGALAPDLLFRVERMESAGSTTTVSPILEMN